MPADRPKRYARALGAGPGAVVIDLEDAVAPQNKELGRKSLLESFAKLPVGDRERILVRVNAFDTPWHNDDRALIAQLTPGGLAGVMLPKAERAIDLEVISEVVGERGAVVPLIESVAGFHALDAIARAPKVVRLAFGQLDLQLDLGLLCDADEAVLGPLRLAIVLASRRADIAAPIDGVTQNWHDLPRLDADAMRAKRGGFGAKLCIHPDQVARVHTALGPTADEVNWARRVCEAVALAKGSVISLDGRMVDAPVTRLAERVLAFIDRG